MKAVDMAVSGEHILIQQSSHPRLIVENFEVALQIEIRCGTGEVVLDNIRHLVNGQLGLENGSRLFGRKQLKIDLDISLLLELIEKILCDKRRILRAFGDGQLNGNFAAAFTAVSC
ncbi:hypothetical protein D3C81_1592000 [compost metagenome]